MRASLKTRRATGLVGIAAAVAVVSAGLLTWGAGVGPLVAGQSAPPAVSPDTSEVEPSTTAAVLIGAGDICVLGNIADARKTAALIRARPNASVFTLGDNSNEEGTSAQYEHCYGPTWGVFKARTRPVFGNHDQRTAHGAPYYSYFGPAAGPARLGYYSYDLAADWHVIVLNCICDEVGGCGAGSPEETWLRGDLMVSAHSHILAMWHIPEFSSGGHDGSTIYRAWWDDLYAAHADIVLNGHDHDYERFAPQSPDGRADPNGIREFVAGTGGAGHTAIGTLWANSEAHNGDTFGVLQLTLGPRSYRWRFIPVAGGAYTDSGETATHRQ